jgi:DNA-binding CsgD family transcriptional regulator
MPALTSGVVGNAEYLDVPDEGHDSVPVESVIRAYSAPSHAEPTTVFHADPSSGRPPAALLQMWAKHDVADMFGVYATRPSGESMTIGIGMPYVSYSDLRAPDLQRISHDWTNIARHLEHALTLREAFTADRVAAEFDANGAGDFLGSTEHHRNELVSLAQRIEHARRSTEHGGAEVWDQLLRGRWSIVRFHRGSGRLRFLAIENPRVDNLRALTPVERAVIEGVAAGKPNKVIASDLDLHLSSVGNIAARAMRKLGIDCRVHLAALARWLARP